MKTSYSNMHGDYRETVEKEANHHIEKLNRILKHYGQDAVQLHASLEKQPRTSQFEVALNLTLPTGALYASAVGADVRSGTKAAFAELERQVKKHQQKVRKDYLWKRKRGRAAPRLSDVPSEG
ncbi:MAG TPA: HPF/RaiA family ribosome-associated protein [Candidatus Acidoferrum sp.]|nr:HPF/RaiA family ribosome-associated protein [Candidatus Acidoferrum sp.]